MTLPSLLLYNKEKLKEVEAMIIDLPQHSPNESLIINDTMKIQDGLLTLQFPINFKDCMYALTYFMKGNEKCFYCNRTFPKDKITLDHFIPQNFGGPTIPNNLFPACKNCNCEKTNMLKPFYDSYLSLSTTKERKQFVSDFQQMCHFLHRWYGFAFIKDWVEEKEIDHIIVNISLDGSYKGKKYRKIKEFYKQYQHFQKPLILDRKNFLLDGFTTLMFAKDNGIKVVPVIVLENVEVIF